MVAALLIAAGLRDLRRSRSEGGAGRRPAGTDQAVLPRWMASLPLLGRDAVESRLTRAGMATELDIRGLVAARIFCAVTGLVFATPLAFLLPVRMAALIVPAGAVFGLGLPDILLEVAATRRQRRILGELPDAIDVLAVATAGGRGARAALSDLAGGGQGPLSRELSLTVADAEAGSSAVQALYSLKQRVPLPEVNALALAIERSSRLGSPLERELNRQAGSLRDAERRRTAEHAARAAPKIQLVIALVLVPSVLLMIAAYLAANAGRFIPL